MEKKQIKTGEKITRKKLLFLLLSLSIILIIVFTLFHKDLFLERKDIPSQIDELFTGYMEDSKFSGAVLVAEKGNIILKKGYGMADYGLNIPNTPKTKFLLASVSKLITRNAIIQLQERGLLKVEDPIAKYIPDYPRGSQIKISHLIAHTSGIPDVYANDPRYDPDYTRNPHPIALAELVNRFKSLALEFEPGSKQRYSNPGYVILAHIVEKVSGTSFGKYIGNNIFRKLKMVHSGEDRNQDLPGRAKGYIVDNGSLIPYRYFDMTYVVGAGSIYSTVEDVYKWDRALYRHDFINKKSLQAMLAIQHYGRGFGFGTGFFHIPSHEIVIIVLSNFHDTPTQMIMPQVVTILLKNRPIKLDRSTLDKYVGTYQMESQSYLGKKHKIIIKRRRGYLLMAIPGLFPVESKLLPETRFRFLSKYGKYYSGITAEFPGNDKSEVDKIVVNIFGYELKAYRVNE